MLRVLSRFIACVFPPPPRAMLNNPFLQLLASDITTDTISFLSNFQQLMVLSPIDPHNLANRFIVDFITLNKHMSMTLQHEYLSVHVSDVDSKKKYLIFLERTMFDVRANQASFNSHPDCPRILKSIQQSVSLSTIYVPLPQPNPESKSLLDTSPSPSIVPSPLSSSSLASLQGVQGSREVWRKLMGVCAHDQFLLGTLACLTHL